MEQLDKAVDNINQALSLLDSVKSEVADLEARAAAAESGIPASPEQFDSAQVITNADGSVVVTLVPTPAAVSGGAAEATATGQEPPEDTPPQPGPTGQG